jgi:hypothetical protein
VPVDAQLSNAPRVAGSSAYVVPPAAELRLKMVHAEFRDNGAGVIWVPAVVITSNANLPVGSALDRAVTVAAGGSADVSWFPYIKAVAAAATTGVAPAVISYWRDVSLGDAALTVGTGGAGQKNITYVHNALGSSGFLSAPDGFGNVTVNAPCIGLQYLTTTWDAPGYQKGASMSTSSRVVNADLHSLATAGAGFVGAAFNFGDTTLELRPAAYLTNDTFVSTVFQESGANKNVNAAYQVNVLWSAPGYGGGIPGWPP